MSAKSWAVYDARKGQFVQGRQECERREIASLTKIMTAYTVISLISRLDINMIASKIEVSEDASLVGGTTAELAEGDLLNVWDMLHAMLLPSGNDAALALAEYFGLLLAELGPGYLADPDPVAVFVGEMNKNAKLLGLNSTTYANPHGLQCPFNKSTAFDVAKLTGTCVRMPLFAEVVKKQKYVCVASDIDGKRKVFTWHNTNKLLTKGFSGVKTGITPTAGPCLAASFETPELLIVLVLLCSKSTEHRWQEATLLKEHALQLLVSKSSVLSTSTSTPTPKLPSLAKPSLV